MRTLILVDAEDLSFNCPHCGSTIEEIRVHRAYETTQECQSCFGEFQLNLSIEA